MTKDQLIKFIENPSKIDEQSFLAIEKLQDDFPYSYPLSLLRLLHLKENDSYLFTPALSKTALLSPDREKLWHWVEGSAVESKPVLTVEKASKPFEASTPAKAEEKLPEKKQEISLPRVEDKMKGEEVMTPVVSSTEEKDLSHLPEKVRAIIERSRNIQKKIQEPKESKEEEVVRSSSEDQVREVKAPEVEPVEVPENDELNISFSILEEESDFLGVPTENEPTAEVESLEEKIEKPITDKELPSEGKHSFVEWMELMSRTEVSSGKIHDVSSSEEGKEVASSPKTLDEKIDLIDQFIKKPPRFKPVKKGGNNIDLIKMSTTDDSAFITETLAQVYLDQKHFDKAIEAYEILRLKYPEKSSLFANRISEIKKNKENK